MKTLTILLLGLFLVLQISCRKQTNVSLVIPPTPKQSVSIIGTWAPFKIVSNLYSLDTVLNATYTDTSTQITYQFNKDLTYSNYEETYCMTFGDSCQEWTSRSSQGHWEDKNPKIIINNQIKQLLKSTDSLKSWSVVWSVEHPDGEIIYHLIEDPKYLILRREIFYVEAMCPLPDYLLERTLYLNRIETAPVLVVP